MIYLWILFSFFSVCTYAETYKANISEFATIESIEDSELDEQASRKLEKLLPRIHKRFCHLKVRPDAVSISVYLIQVEWSLQRICQQSFPDDVIL